MYRTSYLVDTDVIINYLKGKNKSKDFLMRIIDGEVEGLFSVITEAGLLSGARDTKDEASIYDVLDVMGSIEVGRDIAVTALSKNPVIYHRGERRARRV